MSDLGYDSIFGPGCVCSNIAQSVAALVVALRTKSTKDRQISVSGGITALMGITEPVLERRNIHAAGLVQCINAIIQGNIAYMTLREINLCVLSAHDVVTAKAGKVFGNDQIDAPFFNVGNHPLEAGTVES